MQRTTEHLLRHRRAGVAWASAVVSLAIVAGCTSTGAADGSSSATRLGAASGRADATGATPDGAASGSLFDDSTVHSIALKIDDAAYDAMIAEFVASGEKEWIEATVVVDGVTYEQVGIRLKGNSSLMGIRNGGNGGPNGANVSADDPATLPWLVRLDKYVDGQDHEGVTEFVIRSNNTTTSLNEAVALELIGLGGQATQEAVASRLTVNGGDAVLRLVVENPGDEWDDENFSSDGILYKAESNGDYSYRGDDAAAYEDVFDQETGDEEDYAPLTAFLKFINDSDDATFAADLDEHLEVESFAKYLALQELLDNQDDIDGPGNNSYLRYDETTGRITIVSWDLNLAFGGLGAMGPGAGGAGGPGGAIGTPPSGAPTRAGNGATAGATAGAPTARTGGPSMSRSNVLVTRFLANATFKALYDQALADLQADLVDDGTAAQVLAKWKTLLLSQAGDVVDASTVESEAAAIADSLGI